VKTTGFRGPLFLRILVLILALCCASSRLAHAQLQGNSFVTQTVPGQVLQVKVIGGSVMVQGTVIGIATQIVNVPAATNYIFISSAGALTVSSSTFPLGSMPVSVVNCDLNNIVVTSINDSRPQWILTGGQTFSAAGDLSGTPLLQNVIGLHFGTQDVPTIGSAQTGCIEILAGLLQGTGSNCSTPTGAFAGPFMVYDAQQYNATPFSFSTAQEIGIVTCTGGTKNCTLASALHFTTGENVAMLHAGAATAQSTPGAPTATAINVTGSTTLHYNCTGIDALGGLVGGSTGTIANAPAVFGNGQIVISSISQTANVVTVNATGINAVAGETVSISGVTGAGVGFNNHWLVATGGANSLTFALAGNAGAGTVSGSSFAQLENSHNITAISRALSGVISMTTDANHNFIASATNTPNIVIVTGASPADLNGWYPILTASGTSITAQSSILNTTETGSVATGSTIATVHEKILVTCPAISGSTQNYAVYTDSPSQGTGSIVYLTETMYTQRSLEDWGIFYMSSGFQRNYMPGTPLASGVTQPQLQANTICAGGGTTTLTMCNNVTQSVTSAGMAHDAGSGIQVALQTAAANGGGAVYLSPIASQFCQYPINMPVSVPQFTDLILGCNILGNETVTSQGFNHIYTLWGGAGNNQGNPQFPTSPHYQSWFGSAKEFLHGGANNQSDQIQGIAFGSFANNQNYLVMENSSYDRISQVALLPFAAGSTTSANNVGITYMGGGSGGSLHELRDIASTLWGPLGVGGNVGTIPGIMSFGPLIPAIWIRSGDQGNPQILGAQFYLRGNNTISGRGILIDQTYCSNCVGQNFEFGADWNQGPSTPWVTFLGGGPPGGISQSSITVAHALLDSSCAPVFANFTLLAGSVTLDEDTSCPFANLVSGNVTPSLMVKSRSQPIGQNVFFIDLPSSNTGNSQRLSFHTPTIALDAFGDMTKNGSDRVLGNMIVTGGHSSVNPVASGGAPVVTLLGSAHTGPPEAVAATPTIGHSLIAMVSTGFASTSNIADSLGNPFTKVFAFAGNASEFWVSPCILYGNQTDTVTHTVSGNSQTPGFWVFDVTNLNCSNPFSQGSSGSGTGTAASLSPLLTSQSPNDLVFTFMSNSIGNHPTIGGGYTSVASFDGDFFAAGYQNFATPQTQTGTNVFTFTSQSWLQIAATFQTAPQLGSASTPWAGGDVTNQTVGTLQTQTKCAAQGSSAGTSLVACGSAAAGLFSVPITTPTAATVSTTAIGPNSVVIVQQRLDTAAGTALGVTCNSTANATFPNVNALVGGTSFTIPLAAFAVNPGCYEYWIINQ
jgi:hypothetical protein